MLDLFIWILIVALFIASFVGVFIPVIPAVIAVWLGFLAYHFFIDDGKLTLLFWLAMGLFTVILIVADFVTNRYFVDKFGGSKWSEWGAIIGVLVGVFIYPPIGVIVVPFLIVMIIELIRKRPFKLAMFAATGALAGFLSGVVAKVFIQFVMIVIFFIVVLFF